MKCPACYYHDTKVLDSRVSQDGFAIRRRRSCIRCGLRFSTYEEIEILDLIVIKRDSRRESYDREKLIGGLARALEKRPISDGEFKKLVNKIERDIQLKKKNEIKSSEIGDIVMKHLKKVDQVAYIRFASVYRAFEDVGTFKKELNRLFGRRKKRIKKRKEKS